MPIMDGGTSTTRIRSHEVSDTTRGIPPKHLLNGRVPIFAVSASLVEERRKEYMELGFDGWILKPVDFKRLQILMEGILDSGARQGAAYQPGAWERGGWFLGSPEEAGSSTPRSEDATSP
jgi:CheY-like chemotaxis protein